MWFGTLPRRRHGWPYIADPRDRAFTGYNFDGDITETLYIVILLPAILSRAAIRDDQMMIPNRL